MEVTTDACGPRTPLPDDSFSADDASILSNTPSLCDSSFSSNASSYLGDSLSLSSLSVSGSCSVIASSDHDSAYASMYPEADPDRCHSWPAGDALRKPDPSSVYQRCVLLEFLHNHALTTELLLQRPDYLQRLGRRQFRLKFSSLRRSSICLSFLPSSFPLLWQHR